MRSIQTLHLAVVGRLLVSKVPSMLAMPTSGHVHEETKAVEVPLNNVGLGYTVNIGVGTSQQPLPVIVDIGSDRTWIYATSFDPASSGTTLDISDSGLDLKYGGGDRITGGYFADDVRIGSAMVKNMTLGLATSEPMRFQFPVVGLLGLGVTSRSDDLLGMMMTQGIVGSRTVALWLDHDGDEPSMILGGFDRSKYRGDMTVFPMQPDPSSSSHSMWIYAVNITEMSLSTPDGDIIDLVPQDFNQWFAIDSGSTGSHLPAPIVDGIVTALEPFGLHEVSIGYVAPCHLLDQAGGLDLGLRVAEGSDSSSYRIHYRDLFSTTERFPYSDDIEPGMCKLMVKRAGQYPNVLGQQFLRSIYTVTNLDEGTIGLAQAVQSASRTTDVQKIAADDPFWRL